VALGKLKESWAWLLWSRWLLWFGVGFLEFIGLAVAGIALEGGNRFLAAVAFLMGLAGLCLLAWEGCRDLLTLLNASARGDSLAIARTVDQSLSAIVDRARRETELTPEPYLAAVLDRWEREFLTAFCARPVLPRLAGRLAGSAAAACLAALLLLSLLAMSLAIANCAGGICEAVYDHSCLTGSGAGVGRLASIGIHFLYYQASGLFSLTGEVHRPVTRGAQALSALTSFTWLFFLVGGLGGRLSVLLLVQEHLTPSCLTRQAIACLRSEFAENGDDADPYCGMPPSARL
jgi:hypothetical protein